MIFKVRDLLVTVLPSRLADDCTNDTRCNGCTNQFSDCDAGCSNARSDFSEHCPEWRFDPGELVEVQEILRLAMIRAEAASIESRLESRTNDDLDGVERRLTSAIERVSELRGQAVDRKDPIPASAQRTFRVDDLMISVLPTISGDAADSGCPACTCNAGCSSDASGCTNTSGRYDFVDWNQAYVLHELRGLMDQALALVQGGPVAAPRSAAELDQLEGALKHALEGVRFRRSAVR